MWTGPRRGEAPAAEMLRLADADPAMRTRAALILPHPQDLLEALPKTCFRRSRSRKEISRGVAAMDQATAVRESQSLSERDPDDNEVLRNCASGSCSRTDGEWRTIAILNPAAP